MAIMIITVEHMDDATCNIRIEADKSLKQPLAEKMLNAVEYNAHRMMMEQWFGKNKGGNDAKS